ncbi:MAG: hypothetical protein KZQ95_01785 [Candidatus Thiodiazotropha sp. (ex Epidulcina cf. delphinae)]|nr:hypothetical protein [Candidatus Thiodiazotropha sp. (ex Epidulcina cf. delphinae)]
MSFFADQYWSTNYWHADYWPLASPVQDGYPVLPIDNRSTRRALNLGSVNLTASGGVRVRNYQAVDVFEFDITHSLVTQAEAESVFADWQNNRLITFSFTWVDQQTYDVHYKEPPSVSHMQGQWWKVDVKLIGHAA